MQIYHVVEQENFPPIREDPLKSRYLAGLGPIDRENLLLVVSNLSSNLPSGTRILAVGSSVTEPGKAPIPHNDIDLKVLAPSEFAPILDSLVYRCISQLPGFKVRIDYGRGGLYQMMSRYTGNYWSNGGFQMRPQNGAKIDVLISPVPYEKELVKSPFQSVVLH